jgi:hypothetical protein
MGRGRSGFCTTSKKGTFHEYSKSRPWLSQKTTKTDERVLFDKSSIDLMKTIDPRILAGLFLDSQRPQHETGVGTRA